LNECVENYYEIRQDFIDLIQDYSHGFLINFSDMRSKINYKIYQKLMSDSQFKLFFYGVINNHDFFKGLGLDSNEPSEEPKKDIRYSAKYQVSIET